MNADARRAIWEENQQALQRNRNRARDDLPRNAAAPSTHNNNNNNNNNNNKDDAPKIVELNANQRRQIWEENQKQLQKNKAAVAMNAPPAPSTPKANGRNNRQGRRPRNFQDDNTIEIGLSPPRVKQTEGKEKETEKETEDVYLARLEKARKEAYEERVKLQEKYKHRDTMRQREEEANNNNKSEGKSGDKQDTQDRQDRQERQERQDVQKKENEDIDENILKNFIQEEEDEEDNQAASNEFASLAESIVSILMDGTIEISYSSSSDQDDDHDEEHEDDGAAKEMNAIIANDLLLPKSHMEWEKQVHQNHQVETNPKTKPKTKRPRRQRKEDNEKQIHTSSPSPSPIPLEKRNVQKRRPRMKLPTEKEAIESMATHQPPTPLADCNSALAQLTKDLNAQEKRANLQKSELIRDALEKTLGELGFLRLYRAARKMKRQATSRTEKMFALIEEIPSLVAQYSPRDLKSPKRVDARMCVEQMFGLLDLEDM